MAGSTEPGPATQPGPVTMSGSSTQPGAATRSGSSTLAAQFMVIAKEPVPGLVKTRLTPAYTPAEAAELAAAALADTLAAVVSVAVARRILALAGTPGRSLPPGFDVIAQRGGGLDERLAWALSDARATCPDPLVFIGMDTPQVTPALLAQAVEPLVRGTADATFGLAEDGGFWLLGLREIDPGLVLGVPMSRPDTGALQLERLHLAGLRVCLLPELADVDTAAEAERIAAATPASQFAARVRALGPRATRPLVNTN
jgi:glycosyltransferase A (GT-A) superfamily protein (DUF2064 family)